MEDALSQLLSGLKGKPKQNRKLIKLPLEWTSLSQLMPEFLEREVILKNKGCDSWAPSKLNYAVPAFQPKAFDSYDQFTLEVVDQWPSGLKLSDFVSGLKDIRFALIMRSKRIDVALAFYGTKMNCEDGQEKVLQRQLDLSDYVKQMVLVNDPFPSQTSEAIVISPTANDFLLEKISDLQSSLTELQEINEDLILDKKKLKDANAVLEKEKKELEAKKQVVVAAVTQVAAPVPAKNPPLPLPPTPPKGQVAVQTTTTQSLPQVVSKFMASTATLPTPAPVVASAPVATVVPAAVTQAPVVQAAKQTAEAADAAAANATIAKQQADQALASAQAEKEATEKNEAEKVAAAEATKAAAEKLVESTQATQKAATQEAVAAQNLASAQQAQQTVNNGTPTTDTSDSKSYTITEKTPKAYEVGAKLTEVSNLLASLSVEQKPFLIDTTLDTLKIKFENALYKNNPGFNPNIKLILPAAPAPVTPDVKIPDTTAAPKPASVPPPFLGKYDGQTLVQDENGNAVPLINPTPSTVPPAPPLGGSSKKQIKPINRRF